MEWWGSSRPVQKNVLPGRTFATLDALLFKKQIKSIYQSKRKRDVLSSRQADKRPFTLLDLSKTEKVKRLD